MTKVPTATLIRVGSAKRLTHASDIVGTREALNPTERWMFG